MHKLSECCDCGGANYTTPLNTTGMGGVDPLGGDPIPNADLKPKKNKKRKKMKSLKQYIKESAEQITPNEAPKMNGLCLLKPEFLSHSEEFLKLLSNKGWDVLQKEQKKLTKEIAAELYKNQKDEDFYDKLCDYMSSDDCLCVACQKDCDDPIKDMENIKDRVRKEWGKDDMHNAMHSSDSLENVEREYKLLFGPKKD